MNNINLNEERFSQEESRSMDRLIDMIATFKSMKRYCDDNKNILDKADSLNYLIIAIKNLELHINKKIYLHCKKYQNDLFTIEEVFNSPSYQNAQFIQTFKKESR